MTFPAKAYSETSVFTAKQMVFFHHNFPRMAKPWFEWYFYIHSGMMSDIHAGVVSGSNVWYRV